MTQDIYLDLFLLTLILVFGWLIARIILPSRKGSEIMYLAFPLGAGIFTWVLFLGSWMGIPITSGTVIGAGSLLLVLSAIPNLVMKKSRFDQVPSTSDKWNGGPWQKLAIMLPLGALVAISLIVSMGRSYSSWDAMAIWSIKGYGIAREGTIFAASTWGAHGLSYPQNIPLLISSFQLLGGDWLPGSKVIFPLFYASLIMGCYQFWRHFKVQGLTAGLGALLVASIPVVFEHGTIGYANLPFTTYLILGCFMTIKGVSDQEPGVQMVGGILFGLACWTRPEGLFLAPILVIALFLAFRLSYPRYTRLSFWLPPIILMGGTWLIFLSLYSGTSTLSLGMQRSLDAMLLGQFPWGVIPRILRAFIRHALTSGIWGALFPASVILSVANIKKLAPNRYPAIFSLTAPLIASGISMGLFFVIVSFVGELNMWIETGMDQMFLPFGLLHGRSW